ncbi:CBO0543 family protein [Paenisporosarcina antarctica]|uniref:Uncharacterized protein n=1 Tax=Paenisporosarcina antarctica TaxID=417367 RepID=A0A4V1AMR9_9BACL|nr:CBO0543 family protein [Paenisporosarcina antarctica]QBP40235.1 hypothetical protein E2636_03310 [Paenisporosarcina antarctica]
MSVQNKTEYVQDIIELQNKLFEINYTFWIEHVLFSFNWWFLIIITILPWGIWWRFVDKKRIIEISLMGTLVMITSVFLDVVGTSFLLWGYAYKDIQMIPLLSAVDITILPIVYMFVYQIFSKWKSYLFSLIVAATGAAFIVEQLFERMDIYQLYSWKHIYSFFIYIAIGIVFKWLIQKMKERQAQESVE